MATYLQDEAIADVEDEGGTEARIEDTVAADGAARRAAQKDIRRQKCPAR